MPGRRFRLEIWVLWAHIAVGLACLPGLLRLETSADTRVFYGDNVYHHDLEAFEATFQQNNNVLILLRRDGERIDSSPALEKALRDATDRAWKLPYALRVDSLATVPHISANGDDFTLEPVLDVLCRDGCDSTRAAARGGDPDKLLDDPLLKSRLVSSDATTVAVYVAFDLPYASTTAVQTITSSVRALARELEKETPNLTVQFVGGITMMDAFSEAAQRDAMTLVPLVIVMLCALLVLVLGDAKLIGLLVATGVYGTVVAMGFAGWAGMKINVATSIVPVLIITFAVASGLHLLVTYSRQRVRSGVDAATATKIALDLNLKPTLLTAIMSLVGFVSMNSADSPPLRDMGNLVSIGLTAGTTSLLWVVPLAMLRIRRVRVLPTSKWTSRVVEWISDLRGAGITAFVVIFALVTVTGLARITLNDDFVKYFDESFEFRRAADFAEARMGGPNYVDIVLSAPQADGIYDPEYMDLVARFSAWLRERPLVASVVSVADVVSKVADAFSGNPDLKAHSREEIAQYVLTYELSLTAGQDLEDYFDKSRRSTRISTLLNGGNSQTVIALEDDVYRWFEPYKKQGYSIVVTGINVPVAHMSILNVTSMLSGIFWGLVANAIVLGIYFKSVRILLLTAPAIFLPSAMGFGLWGWLVGEIGLAASIVAAMTIGIIIDDAIHIIYRYQYTRDVLNEAPDAAARLTVNSVGFAILATSVALAVGFLILGLSGFAVSQTLGLLTAIILVCGLVVDLILVPRALAWLDLRRYSGASSAAIDAINVGKLGAQP